MDITKTIIITSSGIVAFAICLTIAQLIFRKEKAKSESEGSILLAFGILYSSWIIGFTMIHYRMLLKINELLDAINKINIKDQAFETTKNIAVFIGIANTWLILFYFISNALSKLFFGNRNDVKEIESNNYVLFILKGTLFIGLIHSFMPILDELLNIFIPVIDLPFYR